MKREIKIIKPRVGGCCPGHDDWPDDKYGNRRSVKARARGIAKEHRLVRRTVKQNIRKKGSDDE